MTAIPRHLAGLGATAALLAAFAGWQLGEVLADVRAPHAGFLLHGDATIRPLLSFDPPIPGVPGPADRVVAVDGVPTPDGRAAQAAIDAHLLAGHVTVTTETRGGGRVTRRLPVQRGKLADWLASGLLYWLSGATIVVLGLAVAAAQPAAGVAWLYCAWSVVIGSTIIATSVQHPGSLGNDQAFRQLVLPTFGALGIMLFARIPRRLPRRLLRATDAFAVAGGVLLAIHQLRALASADAGRLADAWGLGVAWQGLGAVGCVIAGWAWARFGPGATDEERAQARLLAWGALISYTPAFGAGIVIALGANVGGLILACPVAWVMPAAIALAIVRHRMLGIDVLLRPALAWAIAGGALAVAYAGCVALSRSLLGGDGALAGAMATAAVALAFAPLRDAVKRALDAQFLRAPYDAEAIAAAFEREAGAAGSVEAIATALDAALEAALHPRATRIRLGTFTRGDAPAPALRAKAELDGELALGPARSGRAYRPADEALAAQLLRRAAELADRLAHVAAEARAQERAEGLAHANAMMDRFLSLVSHELRTPVSALLQATSVVEPPLPGDPYEPDWEAYRQRVYRQSETLSLLVDDLLHAAQLQAGAFHLAPQPLDLAELVDDTFDELEPLAAARGLSLALEAPDRLALVRGDRHRVAQVLRNLLHNAIKHGPAGSRVVLALEPGPDALRVTVTDAGPGVPAAQRAAIFDLFARLDHGPAGVGLGLYIVRAIAEAHFPAGHAEPVVGVEDAPGGGARFWVRLPWASSSANGN